MQLGMKSMTMLRSTVSWVSKNSMARSPEVKTYTLMPSTGVNWDAVIVVMV